MAPGYAPLFGFASLRRVRSHSKIQKALLRGGTPADPVILEHAGDIFYGAGEKKKALEYWKRALEFYSPDVDPERVLSKIHQAEQGKKSGAEEKK